MTRSLEPGLLWVEVRIRTLSVQLGRPVDCVEWPRPLDPYGDGPLALEIWRGGRFRVVDFAREELREVKGNVAV